MDSDGCPFCCEFSCRLTPTPTPFFDAAGRRIFERPPGPFLVVIEGSRGSSNRPPGTTLITAAGQRPDVQLLASNDWGNGSEVVCDSGPPPTPVGGVPGVDPAEFFGPGDAVTLALRDISCRMSLQETSGVACTRDRSGLFSYLGQGSLKQFCLTVSQSIALPQGDTLVAVQLLDDVGNVGPRKEIIIRVTP